MKLSIDDIKEIVDKVTQGGGDYTPLEAELARMVLKYRATIGRLAAEKAETFDALYSVYATLNGAKCADGLREKHRKVLAGNSKRAFAEAVKLERRRLSSKRSKGHITTSPEFRRSSSLTPSRSARTFIFTICNAVKYLLRCGAKQGESWQDDVAKAENYLHRARTGEWMKEAR